MFRGFWGSSLIKPPFRVTSADVVIICPEVSPNLCGEITDIFCLGTSLRPNLLGWMSFSRLHDRTTPVGGWTNPFETYARQNGFIFPKVRGENKKYLKPPLVHVFGDKSLKFYHRFGLFNPSNMGFRCFRVLLWHEKSFDEDSWNVKYGPCMVYLPTLTGHLSQI